MSRMVDMPQIPCQIKRISEEVLENRQLGMQHIAQINYLQDWLAENGVNIHKPPAPPRKPPTKKRKTSGSSSPLGNWLKVTSPTIPEQLECTNCSVVIPSTFNKIIKTLHKKTRRSLSDIVNTFQFVEPPSENLNTPEGFEDGEIDETLESNDTEVKVEGDDKVSLSKESLAVQQPGSSKSSGLAEKTVQRSDSTGGEEENREKSLSPGVLDLTVKSPRKCAAKFRGIPELPVPNEEKAEEKAPLDFGLDDIIEFEYDDEDKDKLMHRVTFFLHGYEDATPKRIFLDPWIVPSYSGEQMITSIYEAAAPGTIEKVSRTWISQPWRQFRNFPFSFTEVIDLRFILPSGRPFSSAFGYVKSQTKSTSVGAKFMIENNVKVRFNSKTGKGIIYINGEALDCSLIISGPVRPEVQWTPREPLKEHQTMPSGFAKYRLEKLQKSLKEQREQK